MAHLAGQGGDDALCVHQRGVAEVVQAVRAEDLGAGLEPHRLAEGGAVLQMVEQPHVRHACCRQVRLLEEAIPIPEMPSQ